MKLSKLLKKITVAVSVLMIAGMLAACSSPSGSGSGSGSGSNNGNNNSTQQPGTGEDGEQSKITYKDSNTEMTMTVPAKYLDSALNQYGLTEGTDYTKDSSGKNATLTKSGYDKIKAKEESSKSGNDSSGYSTYSGVKDGYYSLWYNGNCLGYVKESGFALMIPGLKMTTPDDYTVDETDKKVIFTASGFTKFLASASNS